MLFEEGSKGKMENTSNPNRPIDSYAWSASSVYSAGYVGTSPRMSPSRLHTGLLQGCDSALMCLGGVGSAQSMHALQRESVLRRAVSSRAAASRSTSSCL